MTCDRLRLFFVHLLREGHHQLASLVTSHTQNKEGGKTLSENPYESVTERRDIPDVLKVPSGNSLLLRAYGKGVQIYTCPDTTHAKPHAILLESDRDEGDLVAIHFAGPSWQATKDGSIVVGDTSLNNP